MGAGAAEALWHLCSSLKSPFEGTRSLRLTAVVGDMLQIVLIVLAVRWVAECVGRGRLLTGGAGRLSGVASWFHDRVTSVLGRVPRILAEGARGRFRHVP